MTAPGGGFYSATDADSEGEEGTFFLWTPEQIKDSLSESDAELSIELFGVSENGNFEESNILHLPNSLLSVAQKTNLSLDELSNRVDQIREDFYQAREKRIHPLRDEKILTAWNGMMISSLAQAGVLLDEPRYTRAALRAAEFVWNHNRPEVGKLLRVHLDGSSSIPAQQEDYAYFAEGLLHLYDATGNTTRLERAIEVTQAMHSQFWDDDSGGFYMSTREAQITSMNRPKDGGSDNAIPSGNSVALRVLQMLDVRSASFEYAKRANATLTAFADAINQHPTSFGYMLTAASDLQHGELAGHGYVARGGVRATARQIADDRVAVELVIPDGWHVNSNQPLQKGLIPTAISIQSTDSDWQLEDIRYPQAITAELGFQEEALSLYQGNVVIEVTVKSGENSPRVLPLSLGIQACDDRVCLPPETVRLGLAMKL